MMGGHPSVMLIPPMLALAELLGATGRDLALRLCRRVRNRMPHRPRRALPPLRQGLAPHRDARASSVPSRPRAPARASRTSRQRRRSVWPPRCASGLKANFGTMTKPLHVGHAARNGLFAALMVQRGLHRQSRRAGGEAGVPRRVQWPRHLRRRAHPGRLVCAAGGRRRRRAWPEALSVLRLHALLDQPHDPSGAHPRSDAGSGRDDRDHAASAPPAAHEQSRSAHAARRQVQHPVRGGARRWPIVRCGWSTSRAMRRSIRLVRELMARTTARPHPDMPENAPLQWGAEVVVTTRDGQRFASRLDDFERRGPGGQPMTHGGTRGRSSRLRRALAARTADRAAVRLPEPDRDARRHRRSDAVAGRQIAGMSADERLAAARPDPAVAAEARSATTCRSAWPATCCSCPASARVAPTRR